MHDVVLGMSIAPGRPASFSIRPQAVTRGPGHHFFGYYDKSPWDASGRWMLGLESAFMDRPPTENDPLVVGLIDTANGHAWKPLAETRAWNWQQGCMLQWLDGGRANKVVFNDRRDGRFVSRVLDVETGRERLIERPVYAVNPAGTHAVSLNFSRLHSLRPGYGYPGIEDAWRHERTPAEDGLFSIDLATGAERLILSVADAAEFEPRPDFAGVMHRFNHAQFSPGGQRFACLHRWKKPEEEVGTTRLLTLNVDGSDVRCLADDDVVSHYDWRDNRSVLAWARQHGRGDHYFLFGEDGAVTAVGESVLTVDGHCSFSPDRRWVLTDTYPNASKQRVLLLYHWATGRRIDIGHFRAPPVAQWETRCDLHPRWSPDGRQICLDSAHEDSRQMYVLDVSEIVASGE